MSTESILYAVTKDAPPDVIHHHRGSPHIKGWLELATDYYIDWRTYTRYKLTEALGYDVLKMPVLVTQALVDDYLHTIDNYKEDTEFINRYGGRYTWDTLPDGAEDYDQSYREELAKFLQECVDNEWLVFERVT